MGRDLPFIKLALTLFACLFISQISWAKPDYVKKSGPFATANFFKYEGEPLVEKWHPDAKKPKVALISTKTNKTRIMLVHFKKDKWAAWEYYPDGGLKATGMIVSRFDEKQGIVVDLFKVDNWTYYLKNGKPSFKLPHYNADLTRLVDRKFPGDKQKALAKASKIMEMVPRKRFVALNQLAHHHLDYVDCFFGGVLNLAYVYKNEGADQKALNYFWRCVRAQPYAQSNPAWLEIAKQLHKNKGKIRGNESDQLTIEHIKMAIEFNKHLVAGSKNIKDLESYMTTVKFSADRFK